jgi:hypothetical protein
MGLGNRQHSSGGRDAAFQGMVVARLAVYPSVGEEVESIMCVTATYPNDRHVVADCKTDYPNDGVPLTL